MEKKYKSWTNEQLCDYLVETITNWAIGRDFPQLECFLEDIRVHLLDPDWFEEKDSLTESS